MPQIKFIGKVLPEAVKITLQGPEIKWKWQEVDLEPAFCIKINNSIVTVECEIEKYEPSYFGELYRRALDLARASANLVAFTSGYGLIVTLDTLIDPARVSSAIVFTDTSLPPLCTAFGLETSKQGDFDTIFRMVLSDPPLFMALNDLINAITLPHCSLVNCGRVVDSIRRIISPKLEGHAAWRTMHEALNISRPYQEWISKQSTGPRHADPTFNPGAITTEATRRTWIIMNRFLEYRKRGSCPLIAPDFPQLS